MDKLNYYDIKETHISAFYVYGVSFLNESDWFVTH